MKEDLEQAIAVACQKLFKVNVSVVLTRTDEQFGDYTSNVAMQLAGQLNKKPLEIAKLLADKLEANSAINSVEVAAPGFLNFKLSDDSLWQLAEAKPAQTMKGKVVLVEYLDPNPFKELHIGHAYSGTLGDAIASLFQVAGGQVHRVTYQGDVGLHVAKALYGIFEEINGNPTKLDDIKPDERSEFLGRTYAKGATAYEKVEAAKQKIIEINKKVYDRSDELQNQIYDICKQWSLDYFNEAYRLFNFTPFEKNYMESQMVSEGKALVEAHLSDGVFQKSDGALVFKGEQYGLHTRVFINSEGLPTYEAKDLGNAVRKWQDYHQDRSIIITGQEQAEYFKVMLKALEQFEPEQAKNTTHIAHGLVSLTTGKMSSRTGNVLRALDVLGQTVQATKKVSQGSDEELVHQVALAAMKYTFLKNRIGGNIAFDINESVAITGNSGPYLQYAHARARSILAKTSPIDTTSHELQPPERSLLRKIGEYAEVVDKAVAELMPHHICTYLYELAQTFNSFYENNRVVGDDREGVRANLVKHYAETLKNGLELLNIAAPAKM